MRDYDRWRRVVFQFPTAMTFQRMDQTFAGYGATVDMARRSILLTRGPHPSSKTELTFDRPDAEHLTLTGTMDGHKIRMQLERFDHTKMLLLTRGLTGFRRGQISIFHFLRNGFQNCKKWKIEI